MTRKFMLYFLVFCISVNNAHCHVKRGEQANAFQNTYSNLLARIRRPGLHDKVSKNAHVRRSGTEVQLDAYIQFLADVKEQRLAQNDRRMGAGRVSFRECNLPSEDRQDCGYYGIREQECYSRECCWGDHGNQGAPACYHSIPTMQRYCGLDDSEKRECGSLGIRKEQCLALDCCWQPTNRGGVPWCYQIKLLPIFEGECGVPAIQPNTLSRIVNGVEARPHSWPWMVSLQSDGRHFCGGSLINEQWVVSAAHCERGFYWGDEGSVVVGLHSQSGNVTTDYDPVRITVETTIIHELYRSRGWVDHDIMLIKLEHPVTLTDSISPVCLSAPGQAYPDGEHCYTTGWGHLIFTDLLSVMGEAPDLLQQVMTPMLDTDLCNSTEWYNGLIDETNVCAGYEEGGRSGCHGDSGGPLVCRDSGHWNLVGIVSFGEECAMERRPEVFAEAADFPDWIQRTISTHP